MYLDKLISLSIICVINALTFVAMLVHYVCTIFSHFDCIDVSCQREYTNNFTVVLFHLFFCLQVPYGVKGDGRVQIVSAG